LGLTLHPTKKRKEKKEKKKRKEKKRKEKRKKSVVPKKTEKIYTFFWVFNNARFFFIK